MSKLTNSTVRLDNHLQFSEYDKDWELLDKYVRYLETIIITMTAKDSIEKFRDIFEWGMKDDNQA